MRLHSHHAIRSFLAACATVKREMHSTRSNGPEREAEGVIRAVDPIGRELTLAIEGAVLTFYVPLDCPITLNDERVKMRLLQPMDWASVRYTQRSTHPIACSVVVDWEKRHPEAELPIAAWPV